MRKESSNQFTEGLVCDLNPINTPNTVLTDALNATIITYDGNEHSLQNDRGNYQLRNCRLKPNYIPVGLKEYGDILYIVSYNPIDEHVEIGCYPSPRNVESSAEAPTDLEVNSVIGTFEGYTYYSDLIKKCKLLVYTGGDEERYKLYPGDRYRLQEIPSEHKYEELEYFILDENRKKHNITNEVQADSQWHNVSWQVPGWLAAQYRIGNFEEFNLNIRSFTVPKMTEEKKFSGNVTLNFQFKISDKLFLPITEGTNSEIKASEDAIKSDVGIRLVVKKNGTTVLDNDLYLTSGNFLEWYMDSKILWMSNKFQLDNLTKDSNITFEAMPFVRINTKGKIRKIYYDNLVETYSVSLTSIGTFADFTVATDLWKFYTDPNASELYLEYDVKGPQVTSEEVGLVYRLRKVDGTFIHAEWKAVAGYTGVSDQVMSSIPFERDFVPENMYIVEFAFAEGGKVFEKGATKKLVVTSSVFGELNTEYDDFSTIPFDTWALGGIKKSTNVKEISIKPTFTASTKAATADFGWDSSTGDFEDSSGTPKYSGTGTVSNALKNLWNAGSKTNKGWAPVSSIDSYINNSVAVTFKKEYNASIETTFSDVDLLTGPLWDQLPGVDVEVKDSAGKVVSNASYSVGRTSIDGKTGTSKITTTRGLTQNYITYADGSAFYTLGNTSQITTVKTMWLSVDYGKVGANDRMNFILYDNGNLTVSSSGTTWNSSSVKKAEVLVTSTSQGINNSIASTIKTCMEGYHMGLIGIRFENRPHDSSKTEIYIGGTVIDTLYSSSSSKERVYPFLVFRLSGVEYPLLVPMSAQDPLWCYGVSNNSNNEEGSWHKSYLSEAKELARSWVYNFLKDIWLVTKNNSIGNYRLVKIKKSGEATPLSLESCSVEVSLPKLSEWKFSYDGNKTYNLLSTSDRESLRSKIGNDVCGKLLTSKQTGVSKQILKTQVVSDYGNADLGTVQKNFDEQITKINALIKEATTVNASLLTLVEKRTKHKGVYRVGTSAANSELITGLDNSYSASTDTILTGGSITKDNLKIYLTQDEDYLIVGKAATSVNV